MKKRTHTILCTFMHKRGYLKTFSTPLLGMNCTMAFDHYNGMIAMAKERHPHVVGLILIDAQEKVLAEWNKDDKEVAA